MGEPTVIRHDGSGRVDDVPLSVDPKLMLHSANAARLGYVPDLADRLSVRLRSGFDLHRLEAVLAAILTSVGARNTLGPILIDLLQVSFRGSSGAGGRGGSC